jgi:flagellar hook-associated protein 2
MAITAGGVGSGLDVNGIVSQLMALERLPVVKLENQGREYESQLSAYGRLRSSLTSFQSAMEGLGSLDKFKIFSASSSDDGVLTATADSNAEACFY